MQWRLRCSDLRNIAKKRSPLGTVQVGFLDGEFLFEFGFNEESIQEFLVGNYIEGLLFFSIDSGHLAGISYFPKARKLVDGI